MDQISSEESGSQPILEVLYENLCKCLTNMESNKSIRVFRSDPVSWLQFKDVKQLQLHENVSGG